MLSNKTPKTLSFIKGLSTEVFLFTSCGDHHSVPIAGVSQQDIQNKQLIRKSEIASFLEHGSKEGGMLASESMNSANSTTWKDFTVSRLQFTAMISGSENAANSYLCFFTNEFKRHFKYANTIQAFTCERHKQIFLIYKIYNV